MTAEAEASMTALSENAFAFRLREKLVAECIKSCEFVNDCQFKGRPTPIEITGNVAFGLRSAHDVQLEYCTTYLGQPTP